MRFLFQRTLISSQRISGLSSRDDSLRHVSEYNQLKCLSSSCNCCRKTGDLRPQLALPALPARSWAGRRRRPGLLPSGFPGSELHKAPTTLETSGFRPEDISVVRNASMGSSEGALAHLALTELPILRVQEALGAGFLGDGLSIQASRGGREASDRPLAVPVIAVRGNQSTVDKIHKGSLGKRIRSRVQIFLVPGSEYILLTAPILWGLFLSKLPS